MVNTNILAREGGSKFSDTFADLVLTGGTVATVDQGMSIAEGIAIRGSRIVAIGTASEISRFVGPTTAVIDLEGKFVMPGFIEGHGHFMSLGRSLQILDLSEAEDWDEIVSQTALAVDSLEPGQWLYGRGWHQDKWKNLPEKMVDGVPTNERLNEIAPENPIIFGHASGHASFVNDYALELAEINPFTPDPLGGEIVRDSAGRATGLLRETAQRLVRRVSEESQSKISEELKLSQMIDQVRLAGEMALRNGVTTFHDAGTDLATIKFLKRLEDEGKLPLRLYVMIRGVNDAEFFGNLKGSLALPEPDDFLVVRSIKTQLDGALGAHGAWLLEPYEDLNSSQGLVLQTLSDIESIADAAIENGYQLNTHAIGDRANREILDLYERVFKKNSSTGEEFRFRVEHAQHVHPSDVPRFGALGVIASVQGIHCVSDGPWIPSRLGEMRTRRTSYPWRDLIDSGALIANGTDVPVEKISPLASFTASVTRTMNNGELFYPAQKMSRSEAIKSYTINNAFAAFEEFEKGSLEVGKLADIAILSDNILEISDERLPTVKVDMTILGGRIVYSRG
tara:strand:+ start:87 stop:1784 length:1698 start_codon:yes stop_codon:yes gene_type:complete